MPRIARSCERLDSRGAFPDVERRRGVADATRSSRLGPSALPASRRWCCCSLLSHARRNGVHRTSRVADRHPRPTPSIGISRDDATGALTSWPARLVAFPSPPPLASNTPGGTGRELGVGDGEGVRLSCPIDLVSPEDRSEDGDDGEASPFSRVRRVDDPASPWYGLGTAGRGGENPRDMSAVPDSTSPAPAVTVRARFASASRMDRTRARSGRVRRERERIDVNLGGDGGAEDPEPGSLRFCDSGGDDGDGDSSPLGIALPRTSPPRGWRRTGRGKDRGNGAAPPARAEHAAARVPEARVATRLTPFAEAARARAPGQVVDVEATDHALSQLPPRRSSPLASAEGPRLQPPPYVNMSTEELTRELARHGMKPGPRGYMVGAMLQVWAAAAAADMGGSPLAAPATAADIDASRAARVASDTVSECERDSASVRVGLCDGDQDICWDSGGDDWDGGEVENVPINETSCALMAGKQATTVKVACAGPPIETVAVGDVAQDRIVEVRICRKRKTSEVAKATPLPLEDKLGLWIKSQPKLYDRVLLMEPVDVDDLLAALNAESGNGKCVGGSEVAAPSTGGEGAASIGISIGCKVPRTKLLAYLEAEGVAVQQTRNRQAKQAKYGNVHF